jgi:hypothetical protein
MKAPKIILNVMERLVMGYFYIIIPHSEKRFIVRKLDESGVVSSINEYRYKKGKIWFFTNQSFCNYVSQCDLVKSIEDGSFEEVVNFIKKDADFAVGDSIDRISISVRQESTVDDPIVNKFIIALDGKVNSRYIKEK